MRRALQAAALAALLLVGASGRAESESWPHGARGAVVLTYDDSLDSQLDHAIPTLDRAGIKGSFFLSGVRPDQITRWRTAAAHGHELGNHTIFHPCRAAAFPADPRFVAEAYTPATMLREIAAQETLLTAIDGRRVHGYATPCGEDIVGGQPYLPALAAAGTVGYARMTGETPAELARSAAAIDPWHLPAMSFPSDVTGATLIAAAREAEARGGLLVILFHGVGGDHLQVSEQAHRELVAWLAQHRETVWTGTLGEAVDWIRAARVRDTKAVSR